MCSIFCLPSANTNAAEVSIAKREELVVLVVAMKAGTPLHYGVRSTQHMVLRPMRAHRLATVRPA